MGGSVFVCFRDGKRQKWLTPQMQATDLRKPYDWLVLKRGSEIPHRAVRAGYTDNAGELFVARNFVGEAGKITISDEPGPRTMWNFWCYGHDKAQRYAEVISLRIGFKVSWEEIKKGDLLPDGAVASRVRRLYVARN